MWSQVSYQTTHSCTQASQLFCICICVCLYIICSFQIMYSSSVIFFICTVYFVYMYMEMDNCPLWHTFDHCKIVFTQVCICDPDNLRTMRLCALPADSTRTDAFSEQLIGCYWKDVSLCETLICQHWVKRPSDGDWLVKVIFLLDEQESKHIFCEEPSWMCMWVAILF